MKPILLVACACLTAGCAAAHPGAVVEGPAPWETAEGRHVARLGMAEQLIEAQNPRQALVVLAAAREEEGGSVALDVMQARAWLALGMVGEASAALDAWLDHPPKQAEYWRVLGLVRFDQERVPEAEEALRRALEIDPRDYEANNNLGFLLLSLGRQEEALTHLRAAISVRPDEPRARNNLGFALAALERDEEALDAFRTTGPEAEALARVGLACERRGDMDEARSWYRRALDADPRQPIAVEALGRVEPPPDGETPP